MKNFNLLVSTSRFNEINASAELWFSLLTCGDKYPIINNLDVSGLISALTNLNAKEVIHRLKQTVKEDPYFFRFILKIVPIDFLCESNTQVISQIIETCYKDYINDDNSFKITLKRRNNDLINRDNFIKVVAEKIDNKVDLTNPDIDIRFEFLGNTCGISFLKPDDILKSPHQQE
jgi:tRNA acetyltransferase TAN1